MPVVRLVVAEFLWMNMVIDRFVPQMYFYNKVNVFLFQDEEALMHSFEMTVFS